MPIGGGMNHKRQKPNDDYPDKNADLEKPVDGDFIRATCRPGKAIGRRVFIRPPC
jgi:hypothetical protein